MILFNSVSCGDEKVFFKNLNFEIKKIDFISIESPTPLSYLFVDLLIKNKIPKMGSIQIENCIENNKKLFLDSTGIVYDNDYFYERLKVKEYLSIFHIMHNAKTNLDEYLKYFGLFDVKNELIRNISLDYKRKLSIARECLKDIQLLIIIEPIRNLDNTASKEIIELLNRVHKRKVTIITLSSSIKEALMIRSTVYHLTENGIQVIEDDAKGNSKDDIELIKIQRIPVKIQDKLVVFNPFEIDYIESYEGQCIVYVKGNKFISNETMNNLEQKLIRFGFFRSHRSYLVNLQKIIEIISWSKDSYSVVLNDNLKTTVPLSKGRIQALKLILSEN